jgi:hypothetical protein
VRIPDIESLHTFPSSRDFLGNVARRRAVTRPFLCLLPGALPASAVEVEGDPWAGRDIRD